MSEKSRIVYKEGTGEIEEKKSRFISYVFHINNEEEAINYIEGIKKKHWDARHNCYAYVIGDKSEVQRYSDDGEPQGTAGKPILEILNSQNLRNTLIVVTRYFGGTLLGTGGLVRAYQQSAKNGLDNCVLANIHNGSIVSFSVDYTDAGRLQYIFSSENDGVYTMDTAYEENVTFTIAIDTEKVAWVTKKVTEATSAKAVIEIKNKDTRYIVVGNAAILL